MKIRFTIFAFLVLFLACSRTTKLSPPPSKPEKTEKETPQKEELDLEGEELPELKMDRAGEYDDSEEPLPSLLKSSEELKEAFFAHDEALLEDNRGKPLKAAAHNDNEEYPYYLEYLDRFNDLKGVYHYDFKDRFIVRVTDGQNRPIWNIPFQIVDQNKNLLWESVTYTHGENIVYPHIMFPRTNADKLYLKVVHDGQDVQEPLKEDFQRITTVTISSHNPLQQLSLDLLFILDTTGSMGDEIQQLKDTIYSIYTRIHHYFSSLSIRFGLILYRDRKDEYVVRRYDFTGDINGFQDCVDEIKSGGGGDTPEDLQSALKETVEAMNWDPSAIKTAFLIADAPPHLDYGQEHTYLDASLEANQKGIKIYTIGASGLDPGGEYIFRQISILTYSEFIFLTYGEKGESDGTGKGKVSHHTGDNYESHNLDDLVVSIVKKEISYQLPEPQLARPEIIPQRQESYLRLRMDNLWTQIGKQLIEFLDQKPVGILPPFRTSDGQLDTLAEYLQEISVVSLVQSQKILLVERERLEEILSEKRLTLSGLIESQNYDDIATLIGANVIFLGEVNYAGIDRVVFMRAVKTADSQIVAAARIRL